MNALHPSRRITHMARHGATPHLYAVGQAVRMKEGFAQRFQARGLYRVTRTLPPREEFPQYYIRSADELHERLAAQNEIEAVSASSDGAAAALMERTFGHG